MVDIDNEGLNNLISEIKGKIDAVSTLEDIQKLEPIANNYIACYRGGYDDCQDKLPTDVQDATGHTVTITKGEKTLILVNPDKVIYGKQESQND